MIRAVGQQKIKLNPLLNRGYDLHGTKRSPVVFQNSVENRQARFKPKQVGELPCKIAFHRKNLVHFEKVAATSSAGNGKIALK